MGKGPIISGTLHICTFMCWILNYWDITEQTAWIKAIHFEFLYRICFSIFMSMSDVITCSETPILATQITYSLLLILDWLVFCYKLLIMDSNMQSRRRKQDRRQLMYHSSRNISCHMGYLKVSRLCVCMKVFSSNQPKTIDFIKTKMCALGIQTKWISVWYRSCEWM